MWFLPRDGVRLDPVVNVPSRVTPESLVRSGSGVQNVAQNPSCS